MKIILKDADFSANNIGKEFLAYINILKQSNILPLNTSESLGKPIVSISTAEAPISGMAAYDVTYTRSVQTSSYNTSFLVMPEACASIPANYKGSIVLGFWTTQMLYDSQAISGIIVGNNAYASTYGPVDIRISAERTGTLNSSNVTGTWKGKVVEEKIIDDVTWRYVCAILTLEDYTSAAIGAKPLALPGYNAYSLWFGRDGNTDETLTIRIQNITMCYGDEYLDPYKVY